MNENATHRYAAASVGRSRLVLGTAQLVDRYGITPSRSLKRRATLRNAHALLSEATDLGLKAIDTARSYGRAEATIGTSSWSGPVWTKLDPTLTPSESIDLSLRSLGRSWIDVVFIHDPSQLRQLSKRDLANLRGLQDTVVGEIAISVYEVQEVVQALDVFEFRMVQIPFNIFDTRFEEAIAGGALPGNLTYVARSALLQGALAHPRQAAERLPATLATELRSWSDLCTSWAVSPAEAALRWVLSRPCVDAVIVGAEEPRQLRELAKWADTSRLTEGVPLVHGVNLWPHSDPRRW